MEEAAGLLYREARLLDGHEYEAWQELFTDDALYWLPIHSEDDEGGEEPDPSHNVSIIYDDADRRGERVWRTLHTPVLDQNPRSRTVHLVSNIEVETPEGEGDGDPRVWCSQVVVEMRPGGRLQQGLNVQRTFAGRAEYRLRKVDGEWKISLKKLKLINSDQPIYNLTFII